MLILPEGGPAAPESPERTRAIPSCTCSGVRDETLTEIRLAPPALGVNWLMDAFTNSDTTASGARAPAASSTLLGVATSAGYTGIGPLTSTLMGGEA
jgi:hypothetical protein